MGIFGISKKQLNETISNQAALIEELKKQLLPEQQNISKLNDEIHNLSSCKEKITAEISLENQKLQTANAELEKLNQQIIQTNEDILMQSFGLYEPRFALKNVEEYKNKLTEIRKQQKEMIKNNKATTGNNNWTVNGSLNKGKKVIADIQKLLLRAFNAECDDIIEHLRFSNLEPSVRRINASFDAISKCGAIMGVAITYPYRTLKLDELYLAYEYQQEKQKEKEEKREAKEKAAEERKLEKEIEEARKKIKKEQTHYQNALNQINKQIEASPDDPELLAKKKQIEEEAIEIEKALKDVDYREANKRAGYVYVISNIGAFGEGVYKIGMTRRLDPQDRIDELGDASVPFGFDVHAMIFSEDAPKLETALHHAFDDRRLNRVNLRREFFRVTLDEIKEVIRKNYEKTAEFIDLPEAEQYRISEKIKNKEDQRLKGS